MDKLYSASELLSGKPYYSNIPIWYYHGNVDIENLPFKEPAFGDGMTKAILKESVPFLVIKKRENNEKPSKELVQFIAAEDIGTMNISSEIRIFQEV